MKIIRRTSNKKDWWRKHEIILHAACYFFSFVVVYVLLDIFCPDLDLNLPAYLQRKSGDFGSQALAVAALAGWFLAYPIYHHALTIRARRFHLTVLDRFSMCFLGAALLCVSLLILSVDFASPSTRRTRAIMELGPVGFVVFMYFISLVASTGLVSFLHGFRRNSKYGNPRIEQ